MTACITKGMAGAELTEMAALKALGVVAFTDDGKPVPDAQIFRMACRYQQLVGAVLMLHEEEPALSGGGAMNEGAVSAALWHLRPAQHRRVDPHRARCGHRRLRGRADPHPAPLRPRIP